MAVRSDSFTDAAGTGAPDFPNSLTIAGNPISGLGGGSGTGEINYITNPDAEQGLVGWSGYANTVPGDAPDAGGTGGSATFTFAQTTLIGEVLRGTASFKMSKSTNVEGQGVSFDLAIDEVDQGRLLKFDLDYKTVGTFTDGDIRLFIYDVDNAQLITPANNELKAASTGIKRRVTWSSTGSSSYRAIIHIVDATTNAWDFIYDTVVVGPGTQASEVAITEWQTFTPVWGNAPTRSNEEYQYRRVGENMEIQVTAVFSASGAGAATSLQIPDGKTSLFPATTPGSGTQGVYGSGGFFDSSAGSRLSMRPYTSPAQTTGILFIVSTLEGLDGSDITSGDSLSFWISIPILEWQGKGVLSTLSDDIANANARMRYTGSSTTLTQNVWTKIVFDTEVYLEGGSVSSGGYTVPADGKYEINTTWQRNVPAALGSAAIRIAVNAAVVATYDPAASAGARQMTLTWDCSAGDVIEVQGFHSSAGAQTIDNTSTYLEVTRVSDFSAGSPVGFGIAQDGNPGLINYYEEVTIDASTISGFSSGTIKCVRIGSQVTVTATGLCTLSSPSVTPSAGPFIPASMRPSEGKQNVYASSSSGNGRIDKLVANADGTMSFRATQVTDAAALSITTTDFNVTYNI